MLHADSIQARDKREEIVAAEQEERKARLEVEREKMKADHAKKDELKKQRDKEKLLEKIQALKAEEEEEKEIIEEHQKTKIVTKMMERVEEDEELVFDSDEEQMMRKYRRKEDGVGDTLEGEEENPSTSRLTFILVKTCPKKIKISQVHCKATIH